MEESRGNGRGVVRPGEKYLINKTEVCICPFARHDVRHALKASLSKKGFRPIQDPTFPLAWGTLTDTYDMSELSSLLGRFPTAGLLLLLVLGALGLPFPEDTTLILCGFLIQTGVVRPVPVLVAVYTLLVAIDFGIFWAGRKYGHAIVTHRKFRRIISEERLSALEQKVRKWGVLLILLGRHVVGLRIQFVIATGVFRMPPLKFLIADAVTIPITMAIMVGLGYAGSNSLQIVRKDIFRVEHLAVLLTIAVIVVYLFVRTFKSRKP